MIFSLFTTATLVSLAHPAHAQSTYTLLEPLPTITETGASVMGKEINLNDYINYAINLLIAISAAAAVFMIVWGGLLYMTTDSWNGKSEGKEKVTNAIIGLLMVLSTYIILKTVNPALVAIPATLVPPITGLATSSSKDFYQSLQDDAVKYANLTTEQANQIRDLRTQQDNTTTKLAKLNDDLQVGYALGYADYDPEVRAKLKEIENAENEMLKIAGSKLLIEGIAAITYAIKPQDTTDTNFTDANKNLAYINDKYAEKQRNLDWARSTFVPKMLNTGQDIAPFNLQANYAETALELEKLNMIVDNTAIGSWKSAWVKNNVYIGNDLFYDSTVFPYVSSYDQAKRMLNDSITKAEASIVNVKNASNPNDEEAKKLQEDLATKLQYTKDLVANKFIY